MTDEYSQLSDTDINSKEAIERDILAFIAQHPDFIQRHESVLSELAVQHEAGGATSLLERQVLTLRARNHELSAQLHQNERKADDRLAQLVSIARDNEKQTKQFYQLAASIITQYQEGATQQDVILHIEDFLRSQFNLNQVHLLSTSSLVTQFERHPDAQVANQKTLDDFMRYGVVVCGPFEPEYRELMLNVVDEPELSLIKSAAIVPLRHGEDDKSGLLFLGSEKITRFTSDMGTNFLRELAKIVTATL